MKPQNNIYKEEVYRVIMPQNINNGTIFNKDKFDVKSFLTDDDVKLVILRLKEPKVPEGIAVSGPLITGEDLVL